MNKIRILLAEDERDLAGILRDTLVTLDFAVTLAHDGAAALEAYAAERPDLLVTDVMMPVMDGFSLIQKLRQEDARLPIIVLTARTDTDDVVHGLQLGANDYLRKPFSMRELVARIQALLRQFPPHPERENGAGAEAAHKGTMVEMVEQESQSEPTEKARRGLSCGATTLYPSRALLQTADGTEQPLTQREAEILRRLFAHPNEIVERHGLLLDLWGSDTAYNARSLHVFVSRLRTKLASDALLSLRNVHGQGYRLVVEEN
ncbi:response regulator transcription factor [Alloprevotella sp. oral taxon 473]|uniref:response regulator transcription factor n=1 Tax=Alloprevotella sp. oral taxon 473 TaxID=712469 RepID=UPI0002A44D43|nr:response regulator transcription factor [Alloprevotella sp. oral taxon 473]EKX92890.1 response regulator receiver domain protein [Alloprevotella sp. oral taxon 473 str. F0040]